MDSTSIPENRERYRTMSALQKMREEGDGLVQKIARREPAKVIALHTGIKARHAYNLRTGESRPSWPVFMAMARQYPELGEAVVRWLGLADAKDPKAMKLIHELRRFAQSLPEEGDAQS